ncbi:MAG: hypothetical protein K1060chlam2_00876 [Chlamydiae bacterium]|nr:hypothetical protein [Chlamydiota bacterium]
MALVEGRRRESPRTGLIHFCYDDEDARDLIPLYENICFCLALFRTCIGDNIVEAKEKLTHLLAFDSLPTYLHDYPKRGMTYRLYFPLYWILKLYRSVIEEPLRTRLSEVLREIEPFKKPITIRSSKEAASLALHLQLEGKSLEPLSPYWDPNLAIYCGPLIEERQRKNAPETTLFDLFMAASIGHFSKRLLKPHPVHMHAALVFPSQCEPKPEIFLSPYSPSEQHRGFHLFRMIWEGNDDHLHTFVCQEKEHYFTDAGIFTYTEELPDERKSSELSFYCDHHPDLAIRVNGEQATIFHLDDSVTIETPKKRLTLSFKILEGEGRFMGHISRGNRPAQILSKGREAYDWKISIRTIHRTAKLKLVLQVAESADLS